MRAIAAGAVMGALPCLAVAHAGHGEVAGGLLAGMLHPLSGIDHIIAMVAVGIWAAQLGARAIRVLPLTFLLLMAAGGALGALQVPLAGVEIGIAVSAVTLGVLVAFSVRLPLAAAGALVAAFALCHGHAHGAELPESVNAFAYATGFIMATAVLHMLGIALGATRRRVVARMA